MLVSWGLEDALAGGVIACPSWGSGQGWGAGSARWGAVAGAVLEAVGAVAGRGRSVASVQQWRRGGGGLPWAG